VPPAGCTTSSPAIRDGISRARGLRRPGRQPPAAPSSSSSGASTPNRRYVSRRASAARRRPWSRCRARGLPSARVRGRPWPRAFLGERGTGGAGGYQQPGAKGARAAARPIHEDGGPVPRDRPAVRALRRPGFRPAIQLP
jgi:hypothetical protein